MKRNRFLMGIDNGGSNIKCAIFDLNGEEAAVASAAPPVQQPRTGFVERDPETVWKCNCDVIAQALYKSGIRPDEIAAVSLCGYGGGCCLTDKDGQPVHPIVVSTDTRARRQLEQLRESGATGRIFAITHQNPWEGQPAALLRWFREERPEILDRARRVLAVKDFVRGRLTGEFCGELTDASNNNLIDPATRAYSDRLFAASGLDGERALFDGPLFAPEAVAGYVTERASRETGLAKGTPVAAGLYDVSACTLGCGALERGSLALTNGTWSMASYFGDCYAHCAESTIVTVSALERRFLLEQGSATGAVNLNWYLDNFLSKMYPGCTRQRLYDLCEGAIGEINPQNDIVFVPYLYASCGALDAKGAFFNLVGRHDEKDLLYAVMEGIVLFARRHVELLEQGMEAFQTARLSGGICSSRAWSQMFCDVLQIPLSIMKGSQQGARGAAMCAGVAAHEFNGFQQAAQAMVHTSDTLYPSTEYLQLYHNKARTFEKALQAINYFHEQI